MVIFTFVFVIGLQAKASEQIKLPLINGGLDFSELRSVLKNNPQRTDILVYVGDYKEVFVLDMLSGKVVKDVGIYYGSEVVVNDAGTYYAEANDYIYYVNATGRTVQTSFKGRVLGFFNQSNILVYKNNNKLIAYDLKNEENIFERSIPGYDDIIIGKDIAVTRANTITLYNQLGNYKAVFEFNSNVTTTLFNEAGTQLLVATDSGNVQVIDLKTLTKDTTKSFKGSTGAVSMSLDSTGNYLGVINENEKFRLYNFKTSQRIYSSLDNEYIYSLNEVVLSKNAKAILLGKNVYSGSNLGKVVQKIKVPSKYTKLQLGQSYTPEVYVERKNGSTGNISSNVLWSSSRSDLAYMDTTRNKFKATKKGSFYLTAEYFGLEAQSKVTVVDTKPPVFKGVKDVTVYSHRNIKSLYGITAKDLGDGNVTSKIKVTGKYNPNKPGKYTLTYQVTDKSGNKAKAKRKITVKYNPSLNMHKYNNGVYLPKSLYKSNEQPKNKITFTPYNYVDKKTIYLRWAVEVKSNKENPLKTITIKSKGKSLKVNVSSSSYSTANKKQYLYKGVSTKEYKWLTKNIAVNKKAVIIVESNKKKTKKTLSKKEKQAIVDGLLLFDYLAGK